MIGGFIEGRESKFLVAKIQVLYETVEDRGGGMGVPLLEGACGFEVFSYPMSLTFITVKAVEISMMGF